MPSVYMVIINRIVFEPTR